MRDRLIELHRQAFEHLLETGEPFSHENYADFLLANGVIVPPFKVGDTVYWACDLEESLSKVYKGKVRGLSVGQNGTTWFSVVYEGGLTFEHTFKDYWEKTVFLTREEAEKALKERSENGT